MGVAVTLLLLGILTFWISGTGPLVLDALFGLDTISGDGTNIGGYFGSNT